jgi:triacylglycerol lipase
MSITNSQAAQLGRLSIIAMDMYTALCAATTSTSTPPAAGVPPPNQNVLTPTGDPRIIEEGWELAAYIVARDALFQSAHTVIAGTDVYYGFLARSATNPDNLVAVVRGTNGMLEWIEDAEFASLPHPTLPGGAVEQGFWGIYASMRLVDSNGNPIGSSAADGITQSVGTGTLMVVGHSLGSALSTYLVFDLADPARLGTRVSACLFASPQTGDQFFADAFDKKVSDYRVFNYALDIVPRVPLGPDYVTLARATVLMPWTSEASIRVDVFCNHHVICYCAMLDYEATMQDPRLLITSDDKVCAACVRGPERAEPTLAKLLTPATSL